ncbi:MAG: ABC transporter substrate-binding protein [Bacteroidales bacterium]|nr:ABC transporter substrate-binding protein [Bacteroidales bacterium]
MKRIIFLCLTACVLIGLNGCKKTYVEPQIGEDNVYVSSNPKIKKDNQRIASVSPQVTEILFALGCGQRLVTRTDFCKFPPQAEKIQSVGGINDANLELIIALRPDIVITSSIFPKKSVTMIEDAGIAVMSFREGSKIQDMYAVMRTLGKITGKEKTADSLIEDCKQRLQAVSVQCKKLSEQSARTKPKVYYVVGFGASGDFSAGGDTYVNEIITLAGGDNIAKKATNWSFNKEELFRNQPDYIFVRSYDRENFMNMHPYSELKAVKEGKVFGIDNLDNQTPRSIDAIEYIFKTIYRQ